MGWRHRLLWAVVAGAIAGIVAALVILWRTDAGTGDSLLGGLLVGVAVVALQVALQEWVTGERRSG